MDTTAFLISLAVLFAVAGIGLLGLLVFARARKDAELTDRMAGDSAAAPQAGSGTSGNVLGRLAMRVAPKGGFLERQADRSELSQLLRQAGWRSPQAPAVFLTVQMFTCVVLALVPVAYWLTAGPGWSAGIVALLAFGGFAIGYLATTYTLRGKAKARQRAIRCEVRLFVQLLTMIMDVGLSTRQTLATIAREARPVMPNLADEIAVALRQIEAGGGESEVLRNMAEELDVPELTSVINILRQVERFGGGVREPLLETLERIEEHNKFRLQEQVGKTSARMTMAMVVFFIPAILAFTAGPGFIGIIRALDR